MCFNTNHIEDIEPSANRECGGCVIKAWSDSPNVQTETIISNVTKEVPFALIGHRITNMQAISIQIETIISNLTKEVTGQFNFNAIHPFHQITDMQAYVYV